MDLTGRNNMIDKNDFKDGVLKHHIPAENCGIDPKMNRQLWTICMLGVLVVENILLILK